MRTTTGIPPTQRDLGNEADIFIDDEEEIELKSKQWKLDMKAFIRGSARASLGPTHDGDAGLELHAPARIPGLSSGDWNHIGVVPNPSAKAYFTVGKPTVSANVIVGGQPPMVEGYVNPKEMGWFLDAYLVQKFPRAFDQRGGIAWTVGSFGNRYGNAGRKSTGYYRTYLFGKTHAMSSVLTADIDLTKHWELVAEHGIGAKLDTMPWINPSEPTRPDADFLPGQGDVPRGSNFIHHAHLQLRHDYWFRVTGHWLTSWSPNDRALLDGAEAPEARLTVVGADAHFDLPTGNGYIGYSHMDAEQVLPLSNGVQVLHASRGTDIKKIYFGFKDRLTGNVPSNDSGTVDTILFQYIVNVGSALRMDPDFDIGLFGMYAHVDSPIRDPNITTQQDIEYDRVKWGAELLYGVLPFMRVGLRFDNVHSNIVTPQQSFSAISPRLFFFTKNGSKEMIVLNYSHFLYGADVYPGSPFNHLAIPPDPHFFGLSALMSL